ncbi:glycosyltransferase [Microbacter sp. ANSKLAB05]|nr:glycosyltransferase [Microbacter sp. ANSKLAB05]
MDLSESSAGSERGQDRRIMRVLRRAASTVHGRRSQPPTRRVNERTSEADEARRLANKLWERGLRDQALHLLAEHSVKWPDNALLALSYGTKLHQSGNLMAARDELVRCLEWDAGNIRAMDLLLEIDGIHPIPSGLRRKIFVSFAESFVVGERDAVLKLFFLAPLQSRFDAAKAVFDRVRQGDGGSEQKIVRFMDMAPSERRELRGKNLEKDLLDALLACQIITRTNTEAISLLNEIPSDQVPLGLVKLAARRELNRGNNAVAAGYLDTWLRVAPGDKWAKGRRSRIAVQSPAGDRQYKGVRNPYNYYGPYLLTSRATDRAYTPVPNRLRYLLHNSLPYHSAGYATRTQGLLKALNEDGWDAGGVTRYGYPLDLTGFDPDFAVSDSVVDGVQYQRLVRNVTFPVKKAPIERYVTQYADAAEPLIRADRPMILHSASNHWNGLVTAELGRRLNLPTVYEVRGLWEVTRGSRDPSYLTTQQYRARVLIEAEAAHAADRVITITNALREEMVSRGVPERKIQVVPNGVDTDRFRPLPRDEKLAARLSIDGRTVVGYVGSILDYEGIDMLVDVAARMKKRRDDVVFLIVGDGAALPEIRQKVVDGGLSETVILPGRVPHEQVESFYSIIDICPFPRKPLAVCEMVSPLKPFEALAMGKAVLSSDVAALAEIIRHGETGLLFSKGSVESLEEALTVLLDDPRFREQLADAGREWVTAERGWRSLAQIVGDIYEDLGAFR